MSYTTDQPHSPVYRFVPVPLPSKSVVDIRAIGRIVFGCASLAARDRNRQILQQALDTAAKNGAILFLPPGRIEVDSIGDPTDVGVDPKNLGKDRDKMVEVAADVTVIGSGSAATTIQFLCGASLDNTIHPTVKDKEYGAYYALYIHPGVSLRIEGVTLEGPCLPPEPEPVPSAPSSDDYYRWRQTTCINHEDDSGQQAEVKLVDVKITGWFTNAINMDHMNRQFDQLPQQQRYGTWLELVDCDISAFGNVVTAWTTEPTPGKRIHARRSRFAMRSPSRMDSGKGDHLIYTNQTVSLEFIDCRFGTDESGFVQCGIVDSEGKGTPTNPPAEYVRVIDCEFGKPVSLGIAKFGCPATPLEVRGCTFRSRNAIELHADRMWAIISHCVIEPDKAGLASYAQDTTVEVLDCTFRGMTYSAISTGAGQRWFVANCAFHKTRVGGLHTQHMIIQHTRAQGDPPDDSTLHVRNCQFRHEGKTLDDWAIFSAKTLIVEQCTFCGPYAGICVLGDDPNLFPPTSTTLWQVDTRQVTCGPGLDVRNGGILTGGDNRFNPNSLPPPGYSFPNELCVSPSFDPNPNSPWPLKAIVDALQKVGVSLSGIDAETIGTLWCGSDKGPLVRIPLSDQLSDANSPWFDPIYVHQNTIGTLWCRRDRGPLVTIPDTGILVISYDFDTYEIEAWGQAGLQNIYIGTVAATRGFGGIIRLIVDPNGPYTGPGNGLPITGANIDASLSGEWFAGGELVLARDPGADPNDPIRWYRITEFRKLPP